MYNILEGVRVLDLSRYISGPSCCRILADMGAEVIKVEKAGYGEEGRNSRPLANGTSLYYSAYNRNKKCITVDFRSDRGKHVLRGLVEKSDVIVENFKAGTMAKMGLSFEEINKLNPRAILVSITGFGQSGPDASRPAYDRIISYRAHLYDKLSEGKFTLGPDLMSDTTMGMNAAMATLLALYDRTRTGKGQWVDCSMLTCSAGSGQLALADFAVNGESEGEMYIDSPNGNFETKDGHWAIFISGPQPMFMRLREIIDNPAIKDEQYIDVNNRVRDHEKLEGIVAAWLKTKTFDEADEILSANGITFGKIASWQDVLDDRQLAYRGDLIQLPVKNYGTVPYVRFPAHFSDHEYKEDLPAPDLGEHNIEILGELLGMTPEEVEEYTK